MTDRLGRPHEVADVEAGLAGGLGLDHANVGRGLTRRDAVLDLGMGGEGAEGAGGVVA
jgi:hypothetical protein